MVFVAQVDVEGLGTRDLGCNQHAFQKAMRVALQVGAVFESARLAFVDVDRPDTGRRLLAHDAPFAPDGETRSAQTTQASGRRRVAAWLPVSLIRYYINSCLRSIDGG